MLSARPITPRGRAAAARKTIDVALNADRALSFICRREEVMSGKASSTDVGEATKDAIPTAVFIVRSATHASAPANERTPRLFYFILPRRGIP